MKIGALLAGCGALLLGACAGSSSHPDIVAPRAGALRGDEKELQGRWEAKRTTIPAVSTVLLGRVSYEFRGRRYFAGQRESGGYFRLDETARPKRIDFDDGRSPVTRGIYDLQGDRLVLSTAPPGSSRPGRLGPSTRRQFTTLYRR